MPTSRFAVLIPVVALAIAGCTMGAGSPVAPNPPSATGTWSGNVTVQSLVARMTWTVTQTGSHVAGTVRIADITGTTLLAGAVSGELIGTTLSYAMDADASARPDGACSERLSGTATYAQGTPSTLQGAYANTSAACANTFSNGTFTLTSGLAVVTGTYSPS